MYNRRVLIIRLNGDLTDSTSASLKKYYLIPLLSFLAVCITHGRIYYKYDFLKGIPQGSNQAPVSNHNNECAGNKRAMYLFLLILGVVLPPSTCEKRKP